MVGLAQGFIVVKFGRIKRQHGRIEGLDALLDRIVRDCPFVSRIVPGRMGRKRGNTPAKLTVQYATRKGQGQATGIKCIYTKAGSWQEVFVTCNDVEKAQAWIETNYPA